ncbi:MAG: bifunctional folylpolyglutamate synthase/dihydrofolate synthase [Actinomycetota bacterium]
MRLEQALAELDARQPEGSPKPDLDRIRAVLALLDDPQLRFPTIHVTGTNGKTTTARLATALACAHGLATGLYTSPHLLSVTERMSVCGTPIGDEEFAEEYEHLLPFLRTIDERVGDVTYFESLTALAFLWFADKPIDLGVIEVGMGGTWDATNLVAGDVAVLCPVGLDHPELGSTVAEIATEKAGIIKPGKIAVVREQPPEALAVLEARCDDYEVPLLLEGRDWSVDARTAMGGQALAIRGIRGTYDDVLLGLFGGFAARNAGAAVVALEAFLDRPLEEDAVRDALGTATSPGRVEVVGRRPLVVLDGAHNPAAAAALAETLPEVFTWDRLHLVVAAFADKDVAGILAPLAPLADRTYAAANSNPRSRTADEMATLLSAAGAPGERFASVAEALAAARASAGEGDLILVTGSLYTVADARRALGGS